MSMMVSFCAVLFPRDVLDGIWDLIGSVSEGFPTYFYLSTKILGGDEFTQTANPQKKQTPKQTLSLKP